MTENAAGPDVSVGTDAPSAQPVPAPFGSRPLRNMSEVRHYFRTNTVRMRYGHYRKLGMFIGSGAVEAGCKAVIGQRLKLSGMRWSHPGATGILTLRRHQAPNQWEEIWTQPHNQIPASDHALYGT